MPETTIYRRQGRAGVNITLQPITDEDVASDYRLKLDRPGLAGMTITFTNAEFDEMVAARDKHRDDG